MTYVISSREKSCFDMFGLNEIRILLLEHNKKYDYISLFYSSMVQLFMYKWDNYHALYYLSNSTLVS